MDKHNFKTTAVKTGREIQYRVYVKGYEPLLTEIGKRTTARAAGFTHVIVGRISHARALAQVKLDRAYQIRNEEECSTINAHWDGNPTKCPVTANAIGQFGFESVRRWVESGDIVKWARISRESAHHLAVREKALEAPGAEHYDEFLQWHIVAFSNSPTKVKIPSNIGDTVILELPQIPA